MKRIQAMRCITVLNLVLLLGLGARQAPAAVSAPPAGPAVDLTGTLTNARGEPVPNATVSVTREARTLRTAVSDHKGRFHIRGLSAGPANIGFAAAGYRTIEEGAVGLVAGTDLSRTLQQESAGGWWVVLLLVPGVLGLWVAVGKRAWQEWRTGRQPTAGADEDARPGDDIPRAPRASGAGSGESVSATRVEADRFLVAAVCGLVWLAALAVMARAGDLGAHGIYKVHFFHPSLAFDFYVPLLGFIGALLYVLDLFREGEKTYPKGAEFGVRLIMGPYVAIVMVVLFGHDLGLADLNTPIGKGVLAFFSGFLVVIALQGLIEKGNEMLGQWRLQARYEPSEIAERFKLSKEEDLALRKAGVRFLVQLRGRTDEELGKDVARVGFDQHLALGFKRRLEREAMRDAMGDLVWKRLEKISVNTLEEFANLADVEITKLAAQDPQIHEQELMAFRGRAKEFDKHLVNAGS